MVRPARFELATYGFVVRHSIQLSYGRIEVVRPYGAQLFYHTAAIRVNWEFRRGRQSRGKRSDCPARWTRTHFFACSWV